jgi:hypothetical protein
MPCTDCTSLRTSALRDARGDTARDVLRHSCSDISWQAARTRSHRATVSACVFRTTRDTRTAEGRGRKKKAAHKGPPYGDGAP